MIKKNTPNPQLLQKAESNGLVAAMLEFNQLKLLYRQGWLRRGLALEACETVAEHVLGVTMLAWWFCDQGFPGLNRDKLMRMALIHDLGEVFCGDITPYDQISPGEKRRRERDAVRRVVSRLAYGMEYLDLWEEYEAGRTNEARVVRQLDRLEMALQAVEYEKQYAIPVDEFLRSASEAIYTPEIQLILDVIKKMR
jgi:putative hydrolase of HD superfamily